MPRCAVSIMVLTIFSSLAWADKRVDKLAAECETGTAASCQELSDIAKNGAKANTRKEAVKKLSDQVLLAEIATDDVDREVRKTAVQKLIGQTLLGEIAKNDADGEVRQAAVLQLTDRNLLAEIAKNDVDREVRQVALNRIPDQTLLGEIAQKAELEDTRRIQAIKKLTDQAVLAKIARNDKEDPLIRSTVVKRITDRAVLVDLAKSSAVWDTRRTDSDDTAGKGLWRWQDGEQKRFTNAEAKLRLWHLDIRRGELKHLREDAIKSLPDDVRLYVDPERTEGIKDQDLLRRMVMGLLPEPVSWASRLVAAGQLKDKFARQVAYDEFAEFVRSQAAGCVPEGFEFIKAADQRAVATKAGVAVLQVKKPWHILAIDGWMCGDVFSWGWIFGKPDLWPIRSGEHRILIMLDSSEMVVDGLDTHARASFVNEIFAQTVVFTAGEAYEPQTEYASLPVAKEDARGNWRPTGSFAQVPSGLSGFRPAAWPEIEP